MLRDSAILAQPGGRAMIANEKTIGSRAELFKVLDGISFAPSCVDFGWQWECRICLDGCDGSGDGWLIRTSFVRPDTATGFVARGFGRWEFVAKGSTESAVVKTAWLLAELVVRHELMEAFLYRGVKIFDPHHTVEELSMPARARGGASMNDRRIAAALRELAEAFEASPDDPAHHRRNAPFGLRAMMSAAPEIDGAAIDLGVLTPIDPWPRHPGVYFVRGADRIKIGTSKSVRSRLTELQCASPYDLELLAVARGGHEEESWFHRELSKHRLHGEWFAANPEVKAMIVRVRSARPS